MQIASEKDNLKLAKAVKLILNQSSDEAVKIYERLLKNAPNDSNLHHHLGIALVSQKNLNRKKMAAGFDYFLKSMKSEPDNHVYLHNFAFAISTSPVRDDVVSVEYYHQALRLKPDYLPSILGLAQLYLRASDTAEALRWIEKALALDPQNIQARHYLSDYYKERGEFKNALDIAQTMLAERPYEIEAHLRVAGILSLTGQHRQAIRQYVLALRLKPDDKILRLNLGVTLLGLGKFRMAWPFYQERYFLPDKHIIPRHITKPLWRGQNLNGKTIYIYREQGYGDMLNFFRYIDVLLATYDCRVVFTAEPKLLALFQNHPEAGRRIKFYDHVQKPKQYDYHLPLMDLLFYLIQKDRPLIPQTIPYIHPSPQKVKKWQKVFGDVPYKKVALCWAGNPMHNNNQNRSLRFIDFAQIFPEELNADRVKFYSFQFNPQQDRQHFEQYQVTDMTPHIGDFDDSAAILSQFDLLITVDTSIAHLAGALGIPVWMMVPANNDWRWLSQGDRTKWYPSLRIFRQPVYKDWNSVFAEVRAELESSSLSCYPFRENCHLGS